MTAIAIDLGQLVTAEAKAAAALDAARAAIAARRWQAEVGGTIVAGVPVHTDERSRANILGAYQEALEDPAYSVLWKGADGAFVALDAATIVGVAKAIRAHVQACFEREAVLLAALEANAPYDIDTGWP